MENDIKTDHLTFSMTDGIGTLTIENPPVNVFTTDMLAEMRDVQYAMKTMDLRVVVIRSEGKYFSAGLDLDDLTHLTSDIISNNLPWLQRTYGFWQDINAPVIASVQKLCTGSGVELMLASDICVAAEGTQFSLPEVGYGLAPDMGGTARLTRLVGPRMAKKILLCGETLDAAEAQRIGLIEYVVEPDNLETFTYDLAKKFAAKPKWALRMAKKGINVAAEGGLEVGLLFEQAQSTFCCGRPDKDEAAKAFFEKRDPVFE